MLRKRTVLIMAVAIAAATTVTACSPSRPASGSSSGASNKSTITIATTSDYWVTDLMYPTLMTMDSQGKKGPSVATKWGYTSPTQGYFDIRGDMKWSDGTALTADDVAWEMNAIIRDKPAGVVTGFMNNFQSATATTPTHVNITLSKPDSTLIPEVGFWMRIIPKHVWESVGNIGKYANNTNLVGAGPYNLTSYTKGQSYTMQRVTPYPMASNGTPTLQTVVFRVYPDVNTELLALKNGDVDVVGNALPPSQVASLKATDGIQVADVPGLGYTFMTYNNKKPPLDNVLVRQALAHAVDNATIRKVVVQGQAQSTNSELIAPVLKEWLDSSAKEYSFDPAMSKSLLQQAGYQPDASGKFPLSFNLVYSLVDPVISQMVTLVKDEAAQAGITINLQGVDRNTFLQKGASGDFDIYAGSFSIEDNPITGMQLAFKPGAANNYTFETDQTLLDMLNKAQNDTDPKQQIEDGQAAAKYAQDKVYANPLFMQNLEVAYRKGWSGFVTEPSQLLSIVNPDSLSHVLYTG